MQDKRPTILLILIFVLIGEVTFLIFGAYRMQKNHNAADSGFYRELAEEYINQGLYKKAIQSYERYMEAPGMGKEKKANVSYIIGNIYMENLFDYTSALASFIMAKTLAPNSKNLSEINKKIVMCLERIGKPVDAERELSKITSIGNEKEEIKHPEGGEVVARIGDRDITMAELDAEIDRLPPYMRDEYKKNNDKKLEFLRQYVAGELLYDSAKKRGYDTDKKVVEAVYRFKKQMMIGRVIEEEVKSKVPEPGDLELELYYKAHKDKYSIEEKDKDGNTVKRERPFEKVKALVKQDYLMEKQQEEMDRLMSNLLKAREVEIYAHVFETPSAAEEKKPGGTAVKKEK